MKRSLVLLAVFMMVTSAFAGEKELIKKCSTVISMPGREENITTKIRIFKDGENLSALLEQETDGVRSSFEQSVELSEHNVQVGLTAGMDGEIDDLNLGEGLIKHALTMTEDPIFGNAFNAGMDLKKVRSVKVYMLDEPTKMGGAALVEAKDGEGKDLGTFLGGFLVYACK